MSYLSEREREIVNCYFGIYGSPMDFGIYWGRIRFKLKKE